ncbi:hypothetical protein LTR56_024852 [Elasticomyces elasticus]|nr:hypothetical protein LTR22_026937 [Elasticomyces elasticus]KAK3618134.1 hypothetical protein LTR56_024852 [Elasticomyces elasticus]KAK4917545.1 hypothetical protein LTR49_014631 [Elasticomyces elasticus]KAK5756331.1 hypothetical protein LTS12_013520 [Elasticomyces elasticus]
MATYGPEVLYEGEEPTQADVVFVHGLGGDSLATWTKDDILWPKALLKERVPHARILTWGYDADPVHFLRQQGHQTILSHAQGLLADMKDMRESDEQKTRPIIFVGHSLGGLVIKQALCIAFEYNNSQGRRRFNHRQAMIGTCCAGVIFIGTPHRGADLAAWSTTATRLAKAIGHAANDDIVASLKAGSPVLESLQHSFAGIQGHFNIHTFLEAQGIRGIGKVVEDHDARLDLENEQVGWIPADHKAMCKFSDKKELGYRKVSAAIKEQIEDAKMILEQRASS